jgi:[protein-PII] uridylyltransferase
MYSYSVDESEDVLEVLSPQGSPQPIGAHLDIVDGRVHFADATRAASRPTIWVEAFRVAMTSGFAVSDQVQQVIRQHVACHSAEDVVATRSDRLQWRTLLRPRPGLHARLVEMRRCGLLGLIFPELGGAPRHDPAHPQLVLMEDERHLAPIARLESLRHARSGHGVRFRAMLDEVNAPELLTLALLLDRRGAHRDHDENTTVRVVRPPLERLQLGAEAKQAVEFLVAHRHDVVRIAFRRDTSDPAVITDFARLAATDQRLKMVCLMALACLQAHPGTSSAWKEDRLWRLYVAARHRVMLGSEVQTHQASRTVALAGRPGDISEVELTQFLDGVSERYLSVFGLAALYGHARLSRGMRPGDVHTTLERHDDIWRLTVISSRQRRLFAFVAGVLSRFEMDIHYAQAMTTPDDFVLDVFEFSDHHGLLGQTPGASSELDRVLRAVVEGTVDIDASVDCDPPPSVHRRPPYVQVGHHRTDRYTVVEIAADDAPGRLHRMSRAIAEFGYDVDLALMSTEGDGTNDILHVTKHGRRLSEIDREALRERLLAM